MTSALTSDLTANDQYILRLKVTKTLKNFANLTHRPKYSQGRGENFYNHKILLVPARVTQSHWEKFNRKSLRFCSLFCCSIWSFIFWKKVVLIILVTLLLSRIISTHCCLLECCFLPTAFFILSISLSLPLTSHVHKTFFLFLHTNTHNTYIHTLTL